MGVFSFPRINVKGLIQINVGTANNDDYSGVVFPDGPFRGQPLRLADSPTVQAVTYGMTDEEWVAWVQMPSSFVKPAAPPPSPPAPSATPAGSDAVNKAEAPIPGTTKEYLPAEWNYYGDMGLTMQNVTVLGVDTGGGASTGHPLVGAQLSFAGPPGSGQEYSQAMLVDVNPEDVPASQVFAQFLTLAQGGKTVFSGSPTKAVTRWINFQRNTALNGPNGAAGTFQCAVPLSALQGQPIVDLLPRTDGEGRPLAGIVCRYVLFRPLQKVNYFNHPDNDGWIAAMLPLYAARKTNPDYAEVVGTIAPWFEGEMASLPVGRVLNPTGATFPLPAGSVSNGPAFGLAPAVLRVDRAAGRVSVDFATTFPDAYGGAPAFDPAQTGNNPKYDLGPVRLQVRGACAAHDFGPVPYTDTAAGDARGWVFDFPLAGLSAEVLELCETGSFHLYSDQWGDLLSEAEWLIASDQACVFAEQEPAGTKVARFRNDQAEPGPATVRVFRRGREVGPDGCCAMTVWEYDTTPNQSPGARTKLAEGFRPGDPLTVTTETPGNRLYTFTFADQADPPAAYGSLPLMTAPMINLRILPNEDYAELFVDPAADPPTGNERLTWEVLYERVLRNYYLLYPAMSKVVPLNDPSKWSTPEMAKALLERVSLAAWPTYSAMPRTRDLSHSRRRLIQGWCNRVLQGAVGPSAGAAPSS